VFDSKVVHEGAKLGLGIPSCVLEAYAEREVVSDLVSSFCLAFYFFDEDGGDIAIIIWSMVALSASVNVLSQSKGDGGEKASCRGDSGEFKRGEVVVNVVDSGRCYAVRSFSVPGVTRLVYFFHFMLAQHVLEELC